jgi:hypothetical protein
LDAERALRPRIAPNGSRSPMIAGLPEPSSGTIRELVPAKGFRHIRARDRNPSAAVELMAQGPFHRRDVLVQLVSGPSLHLARSHCVLAEHHIIRRRSHRRWMQLFERVPDDLRRTLHAESRHYSRNDHVRPARAGAENAYGREQHGKITNHVIP